MPQLGLVWNGLDSDKADGKHVYMVKQSGMGQEIVNKDSYMYPVNAHIE